MTKTSIYLLFAPKKVSDIKDIKKHIENFDFASPIEPSIHFWLSQFHWTKYIKKTNATLFTFVKLDTETMEKINIHCKNNHFKKNFLYNVILYTTLYNKPLQANTP